MSQWTKILTPIEIEAQVALTKSIDPRFAADQKAFYESRTPAQLRVLIAGAWDCNDSDTYQIARSYLARHEAA